MKLSEAIRKGAAMTRPSHELGRQVWVHEEGGDCYACVVGAALVGLCGASFDQFYKFVGLRQTADAFQQEFGLTEKQYDDVQRAYEHGGKTREQVADWVEREYESKLPQKPRESDTAYYVRQMAEIQRVTVDA